MVVNMHKAKSELSKLVERAESGEEVVIARHGKPAVRLVPVDQSPSAFPFGIYAGSAEIPDSVWKDDDAEIAAMFEGGEI